MSTLTGRIALVTGGGTGIGAAISARLADAGATVAVAQPTEHEATDAVDRLAAPGRTFSAWGADLRHSAEAGRLVDRVVERHGGVDILVNNAALTGAAAVAPFLEFGDAHLDDLIEVNLKAAFRCSQHAARAMVSGGRGGVIVNVASVGAYAAQRNATAYVASKAGLVGMTKGIAFELAEFGVRAVAVAPGDIETGPSPQPTSQPIPSPSDRAWWQRATPLMRRGTPDDIAAVVEFLCSDGASFITGETIVVDGGWLSY